MGDGPLPSYSRDAPKPVRRPRRCARLCQVREEKEKEEEKGLKAKAKTRKGQGR